MTPATPGALEAWVQRERGQRLHAAAEHSPVAAGSLRVPFPRMWPLVPSETREQDPYVETKR